MTEPATSILRQELLAANLRYAAVAAPLRKRAYAHIAAKALLYHRHEGRTVEALRRDIAQLLGDAPMPSADAVRLAVGFLEELDIVERTGKRFRLRKKHADKLEHQVTSRREIVDAVLDRHFPFPIEGERLRQWFDDAAVSFFANFGDRWVAAISRNSERRIEEIPATELEVVIKTTARIAGLDEFRDDLIAGFIAFIKSDNPQDNELLWHFGQAMFSARLMAADLNADPLSVSELRGATILFDTNVLLAVAIEKEDFTHSFRRVDEAFATLQVRAEYLHTTGEEYRSVVDHWRNDTLRAIASFGPRVLAPSIDDYIVLARKRGCVHEDDYKRFFDELRAIPERVDRATAVTLRDDPETAGLVTTATGNEALVAQIQTAWSERRARHRPKSLEKSKHDAALTEVVRHLRARGESAWVLTLDRTMVALSSRWAAQNGLPIWIPLDAVVQILAVEAGGDEADAVAFAPILARLIGSEVGSFEPVSYSVLDLRTIDEYHRRIVELPDESIMDIARQVRRVALTGTNRASDEMQLALERAYQNEKGKLGADVEAARVIAAAALQREQVAEKRLREERARGDRLMKRRLEEATSDAINRGKKKAKRRFRRRALWAGTASLLAWGVTAGITWAVAPNLRPDDIKDIALPVLGFLLQSAGWVYKVTYRTYLNELRGVPAQAADEVRTAFAAEVEEVHDPAQLRMVVDP